MSLIRRFLFYEHLLAMQFSFFHEQLERHVSRNSFKTIMSENHVHYSKRVRYRAISSQSWTVSAVNLIHYHCALDETKAPYVVKWIFESKVLGNKAPFKCLTFQCVYTRCASFSLTALCPFWRIYFVAPSLAPALHKSSRLGVPKRLIIRLSCEENWKLSLKFSL